MMLTYDITYLCFDANIRLTEYMLFSTTLLFIINCHFLSVNANIYLYVLKSMNTITT